MKFILFNILDFAFCAPVPNPGAPMLRALVFHTPGSALFRARARFPDATEAWTFLTYLSIAAGDAANAIGLPLKLLIPFLYFCCAVGDCIPAIHAAVIWSPVFGVFAVKRAIGESPCNKREERGTQRATPRA